MQIQVKMALHRRSKQGKDACQTSARRPATSGEPATEGRPRRSAIKVARPKPSPHACAPAPSIHSISSSPCSRRQEDEAQSLDKKTKMPGNLASNRCNTDQHLLKHRAPDSRPALHAPHAKRDAEPSSHNAQCISGGGRKGWALMIARQRLAVAPAVSCKSWVVSLLASVALAFTTAAVLCYAGAPHALVVCLVLSVVGEP